MKTSELCGAALDWAVAKCEGHEIDSLMGGAVWYWRKCSLTGEPEVVEVFRPSTDLAQGGPIIALEKMDFKWVDAANCRASIDWLDEDYFESFGPTPLIAAMRCYVASKLGADVDVPEELM